MKKYKFVVVSTNEKSVICCCTNPILLLLLFFPCFPSLSFPASLSPIINARILQASTPAAAMPTPDRGRRGCCTACGMVCSNLYNARRHVRKIHSAARVTIPCPKCRKVMKGAGNFKQHVLKCSTGGTMLQEQAPKNSTPLVVAQPPKQLMRGITALY